jgi:hypothetical protein
VRLAPLLVPAWWFSPPPLFWLIEAVNYPTREIVLKEGCIGSTKSLSLLVQKLVGMTVHGLSADAG